MAFIILNKMITREDLQAEPDAWFIFGDNFERDGYGGQAAACRGEPNAIGLATKHTPGGDHKAYLKETAEDILKFCEELLTVREEVEERITFDDATVYYLDGIGMGLAGLQDKPIYVFLLEQFKRNCKEYRYDPKNGTVGNR